MRVIFNMGYSYSVFLYLDVFIMEELNELLRRKTLNKKEFINLSVIIPINSFWRLKPAVGKSVLCYFYISSIRITGWSPSDT